MTGRMILVNSDYCCRLLLTYPIMVFTMAVKQGTDSQIDYNFTCFFNLNSATFGLKYLVNEVADHQILYLKG